MLQSHVSLDTRHLQPTAALLSQIKQRSYALMRMEPGQQVLDVGCGSGVDTVALARLVGPTGRVVGIDADAALLAEAREQAKASGVSTWVRHELGDALGLPFAAGTFDACRSERLLQHLHQPARALAEMVRVTKSGGWIVIVDMDWGTLSIDHPEVDIERRMARILAEGRLHNGYSGRQLYRLLTQQLLNVRVDLVPLAITDYKLARQIGQLEAIEREAVRSGSITEDELQRWRVSRPGRARRRLFRQCEHLRGGRACALMYYAQLVLSSLLRQRRSFD
jgi:ubiquinone/menaquinone biosynthesis C-methylase UbiE